ncbi:hypothetical protein QVD99_003061 [Batrachochytrium dendrobatidis]|nr:hypothetical protein QVD99_003061 [Batrachochytrium dendrobatidis]
MNRHEDRPFGLDGQYSNPQFCSQTSLSSRAQPLLSSTTASNATVLNISDTSEPLNSKISNRPSSPQKNPSSTCASRSLVSDPVAVVSTDSTMNSDLSHSITDNVDCKNQLESCTQPSISIASPKTLTPTCHPTSIAASSMTKQQAESQSLHQPQQTQYLSRTPQSKHIFDISLHTSSSPLTDLSMTARSTSLSPLSDVPVEHTRLSPQSSNISEVDMGEPSVVDRSYRDSSHFAYQDHVKLMLPSKPQSKQRAKSEGDDADPSIIPTNLDPFNASDNPSAFAHSKTHNKRIDRSSSECNDSDSSSNTHRRHSHTNSGSKTNKNGDGTLALRGSKPTKPRHKKKIKEWERVQAERYLELQRRNAAASANHSQMSNNLNHGENATRESKHGKHKFDNNLSVNASLDSKLLGPLSSGIYKSCTLPYTTNTDGSTNTPRIFTQLASASTTINESSATSTPTFPTRNSLNFKRSSIATDAAHYDLDESGGVTLPDRKRPIPIATINTADRSGRTLLFKYTTRNDVATCTSLLRAGIHLHHTDHAGYTAFHEACLEGHTEIVSLMLSFGAKIDAPGGSEGDTPLHDAISNGHTGVVDMLLRNGANISSVNRAGQTPMEFASACRVDITNAISAERTEIYDMIKKQSKSVQHFDDGDTELWETPKLKRLMSDQIKLNDIIRLLNIWQDMTFRVVQRDTSGQTLLHHACASGNLDEICRLLMYGSDIDAADNSGWTPLHDSALAGHTECVKVLLQYGADLGESGGENGVDTPLHEAAVNCHVDVVRVLLEYGSDPTRKDTNGQTLLDLCRAKSETCHTDDMKVDNDDIEKRRQQVTELLSRPKSEWLPYTLPEFYRHLVGTLEESDYIDQSHHAIKPGCHSAKSAIYPLSTTSLDYDTGQQGMTPTSSTTSHAHHGDLRRSSVTSNSGEDRNFLNGLPASSSQASYRFAWGGLDPQSGPFESTREEKKFKALWKTIAKEEGGDTVLSGGEGGEKNDYIANSSDTNVRRKKRGSGHSTFSRAGAEGRRRSHEQFDQTHTYSESIVSDDSRGLSKPRNLSKRNRQRMSSSDALESDEDERASDLSNQPSRFKSRNIDLDGSGNGLKRKSGAKSADTDTTKRNQANLIAGKDFNSKKSRLGNKRDGSERSGAKLNTSGTYFTQGSDDGSSHDKSVLSGKHLPHSTDVESKSSLRTTSTSVDDTCHTGNISSDSVHHSKNRLSDVNHGHIINAKQDSYTMPDHKSSGKSSFSTNISKHDSDISRDSTVEYSTVLSRTKRPASSKETAGLDALGKSVSVSSTRLSPTDTTKFIKRQYKSNKEMDSDHESDRQGIKGMSEREQSLAIGFFGDDDSNQSDSSRYTSKKETDHTADTSPSLPFTSVPAFSNAKSSRPLSAGKPLIGDGSVSVQGGLTTPSKPPLIPKPTLTSIPSASTITSISTPATMSLTPIAITPAVTKIKKKKKTWLGISGYQRAGTQSSGSGDDAGTSGSCGGNNQPASENGLVAVDEDIPKLGQNDTKTLAVSVAPDTKSTSVCSTVDTNSGLSPTTRSTDLIVKAEPASLATLKPLKTDASTIQQPVPTSSIPNVSASAEVTNTNGCISDVTEPAKQFGSLPGLSTSTKVIPTDNSDIAFKSPSLHVPGLAVEKTIVEPQQQPITLAQRKQAKQKLRQQAWMESETGMNKTHAVSTVPATISSNPERAAIIKGLYKAHCLPLYTLNSQLRNSPTENPVALQEIHSIESEIYLVDLQLALFLGLKSGRALLDTYPNLSRRVASMAEKTALEQSPVSECIYSCMAHCSPSSVKWVKTIIRSDGKTALKVSDLDIHLIDLHSCLQVVPLVKKLCEVFESKLSGGFVDGVDTRLVVVDIVLGKNGTTVGSGRAKLMSSNAAKGSKDGSVMPSQPLAHAHGRTESDERLHCNDHQARFETKTIPSGSTSKYVHKLKRSTG